MKKSDEFKIARMLEEMPPQRGKKTMDDKFDEMKNRFSSKSTSNYRFRRVGYSIAASIVMFGVGFLLANYQQRARISNLQWAYSDLRSLLIESLPEGQGAANKLKVFDYLTNDSYVDYNVIELIRIYEGTEDENLKLATLSLLGKFIEEQEVLTFLEERLEQEASPLLLIPVINLISEAKTQKGMDILKKLKGRDKVHPAVKNHINAIES